jgi:ABC-2 type transport system ATP-binding protein
VPALELDNVSSGYNKQVVLRDISFKLGESSIYVVLGPNGAGKTTMFRTIAGILEPFKGRVLLDGQDLTTSAQARMRINYLSQYNAMPEEMTVHQALMFYSRMESGDQTKQLNC